MESQVSSGVDTAEKRDSAHEGPDKGFWDAVECPFLGLRSDSVSGAFFCDH